MIDTILKVARRLAADVYTDTEEKRSDYRTLTAATEDYFNPGRSPSTCRHCGAPLLWVTTTSGAKAPLDAVAIQGMDANGEARRIYLSHFSTCPHADALRDEKKAAAAARPESGKSKSAQ